jgi:hypothetical protein
MLDPGTGWLLSLILYPLAFIVLLILIVRSILKLSYKGTPNKRSRIDKIATLAFLLGGLSIFYYLFIADSSNKYKIFLLSAALFIAGVILTSISHPPFANRTVGK